MRPAALRWCAIVLVALLAPVGAAAQSLLRDPRIPDAERSVYTVDVGDRRSSAVVLVSVRGDQYEIVTQSPTEETVLVLARTGLSTRSISTVSRHVRSTIRSTIDVEVTTRVPLAASAPSIAMLELSELPHKLRGFPFADRATLPIALLNSDPEASRSFQLGVKVLRTEWLDLGSRQVETYKLELVFSARGLMGMLGRLAPKTFFWFSVEPPHYLVRFEGGGGPSGTSVQAQQLREYSGW